MEPKMRVTDSIDDDALDFYRYRCCCRSCHVKHGALAVGIFEMVIMVYHFASYILVFTGEDARAHTISATVTFVGLFSGAAVIACMVYGLRKTKPLFLIPHLIMQAISIGVLISLIIMSIIALASEPKFLLRILDFSDMSPLTDASPNALAMAGGFLVLMQDFALVISVFVFTGALIIAWWLFRVVHRSFQYLVECRIQAHKPKLSRASVSFKREIR